MNGKDLLAYYRKNGRPPLKIGISQEAKWKKVIGIRRIRKLYKDTFDMVLAALDEKELDYNVQCPAKSITLDVSNKKALLSDASMYSGWYTSVSLGVLEPVYVKYIWMILTHELAHALAYPSANEIAYAQFIDHDGAPSEKWADSIARHVTGIGRNELYRAFGLPR